MSKATEELIADLKSAALEIFECGISVAVVIDRADHFGQLVDDACSADCGRDLFVQILDLHSQVLSYLESLRDGEGMRLIKEFSQRRATFQYLKVKDL